MTAKRTLVTLIFVTLACLAAAALMGGLAWSRTFGRSQPDEQNQAVFQGITYVRQVRDEPRLMVIHIVAVDLRQPGISFLVTPGDPKADLPLKARTTSQFLDEFGVQLAINGDGVTPWHSNSLLDYYPHAGDPVDPIGLAASQGVVYSDFRDNEPALYFSRTNRVAFNTPPGKIYNAISGNQMLVAQGKPFVGLDDVPQPRTAIGLDKRGRKLLILVVDGRQPGYSEGATLEELAQLLIELGAFTGMNLDGGGSSTLVMEGENGQPVVLNSPIDNHIPGRERPVGNHLGIFAERLE